MYVNYYTWKLHKGKYRNWDILYNCDNLAVYAAVNESSWMVPGTVNPND